MEDLERFLAKVEKTADGCWLWSGSLTSGGYGRFRLPNKTVMAHRWMFRETRDVIPQNCVLDHKCRTRNCVNPYHMKCVTKAQNSLENSLGLGALNKCKTHCKRGHELVGKNVYSYTAENGATHRHCRVCQRYHDQAYIGRLDSAKIEKRRIHRAAYLKEWRKRNPEYMKEYRRGYQAKQQRVKRNAD